MVEYLVDTCILSDVRRNLPGPAAWMNAVRATSVFISVMTIGELHKGILRQSRTDAAAAARLGVWLASVRTEFGARILPVTEAVALRWADLTSARSRPVADGLIAATALVHGLAVVTRNVTDFADTGVIVVNPWDA